MRVSIWRVGVALVAIPLVFGACRAETRREGIRNAGFVDRDSTRRLGPGDIRIVSTDSAVELSMIGDTVITGLGVKALAKIRAETDTGAVTGTGFSAKLEKMIKSGVQSALNKQLTFPVSTVGDVKFDSGKLEFFDNGGKRMAVFGDSGSSGSSRGGMFSESDAQAFIAAFRAKKSASH
jgi:hypothetical protein